MLLLRGIDPSLLNQHPLTPPHQLLLDPPHLFPLRPPPPQGVLVLRDIDPSLSAAAGTQLPLLAPPRSFKLVWADTFRARLGAQSFLTIWRPIAPDKYTALGMVASVGPHPPPVGVLRCVRSDACFSKTLSRSSPNWILPEMKNRMAVYGWTTDDRNSSFLAMSQVGCKGAGKEQHWFRVQAAWV